MYWEPETNLLDRNRSEYWPHVFPENIWIEAREHQAKEEFSRGAVLSSLADNFGSGLSHFFPAYLRDEHDHGDDSKALKRPNLTASISGRLAKSGLQVEDLFYHVVAVLHSPAYRAENATALRMDWPRVPFSEAKNVVDRSAELGRELAALLNPEMPVPAVTMGGLRPELRSLGVPTKVGGGELTDDDCAVTMRWGSSQGNGIVMPGKGLAKERDYRPEEIQAVAAGGGHLGLTISQIQTLLGTKTFDIYLNSDAYWSNVPAKVWEYKLSGYQVIKKWLSYREKDVLDRALRFEEVREVANIVRRIAAILLLGPALDTNLERVKANTDTAPSSS